jgi:hypothetical protein
VDQETEKLRTEGSEEQQRYEEQLAHLAYINGIYEDKLEEQEDQIELLVEDLKSLREDREEEEGKLLEEIGEVDKLLLSERAINMELRKQVAHLKAKSETQTEPEASQSGSQSGTETARSGIQTETETARSEIQTGTETARSGIQTGTETSRSGIQTGTETARSGIQTETETSRSGIRTGTETSRSGIQTGTETARSGIQTETETARSGIQTEIEDQVKLEGSFNVGRTHTERTRGKARNSKRVGQRAEHNSNSSRKDQRTIQENVGKSMHGGIGQQTWDGNSDSDDNEDPQHVPSSYGEQAVPKGERPQPRAQWRDPMDWILTLPTLIYGWRDNRKLMVATWGLWLWGAHWGWSVILTFVMLWMKWEKGIIRREERAKLEQQEEERREAAAYERKWADYAVEEYARRNPVRGEYYESDSEEEYSKGYRYHN